MSTIMTVDPRAYDLIRVMAGPDPVKADEIERLDLAAWPGAELVLGVAFVRAVDRAFGRQPDDRDIDRLAAEAVAGYHDAPDVTEVARLIRRALERPYTVEHTNCATRTAVHHRVLRTLLPHLMGAEAIDEFLGDVMLAVVRLLTPPVGLGMSVGKRA
jgi:hypothetical protein